MKRSRLEWAVIAGLSALLLGGGLAYNAWSVRQYHAQLTPLTALLVNDTPLKRYDRALLASIRIFQQATGIGLAVVLQDKLPPGQTIESQAAAFFPQYGYGKGFQGKAMLFVWSEAERQFKIEVSYELEAMFPDLLCHQLEQAARSYMLASNPYARRDFLTELMVTMRLHYLAARAADASPDLTMSSLASAYGLSAHLSGGAGTVGRDYASALEKAQAAQAAMPAALAQDFAPQASAADTATLYLRSLREGIGAPLLPLLNEGSRYYRMEKPVAPAYAQRLAQFYDQALPFAVWQQGDQAVAVFQAGKPVLPVFLRRNPQGRWLVDEPKGQAYFVLPEQGGAAVQKYANFAYAAAFAPAAGQTPAVALYADRSAPPALLEDGGRVIQKQVQQLQDRIKAQPDDVEATLKLAETLHFDLYWLEAAAPLYERVLQLAPDRNDIRWRLLDVYTGTSDIDAQERIYQELARRTPNDALLRVVPAHVPAAGSALSRRHKKKSRYGLDSGSRIFHEG